MSKSYDDSYKAKTIFTTQRIILISIGWAMLALLYFLLFSAKIPGGPNGEEIREVWYLLGTNIFEASAYLGSAVLCWRNWQSTQIISSRKVWLFIGLGMLAYFIGGIVFGYIEIGLGEEPDVSIADVFFVMTYIFLGGGMALALFSRRINLEKWQWLIVFAVGALGSFVAWFISQQNAAPSAQTSGILMQIKLILDWFYVISDVLLLIIATIMLLAFWGGKVSRSWRMIAAAAFSLYIADMWFKYATNYLPNYQSGDILEVFWVFSGVLFGMGAALEYEASLSLKRRTSGRKRS
ncbi:MAG: hypothetical protein VKL60_13415 [Sphaerospermopsis sp.]|uniref:hypothetical protein n=1 Tax=Sphaerospermopsis sp. LEGE 00249 TaxID=1380707 RepID=UPI00164E4B40|nr:hypothetical protein [Sphaerospermopsis sp. LEGE 00249]MBC5797083.1 hypothetical protein [Sphaerospermopsis sp. LEGE 00249]MEB3150008.1 hypothetical protein [Sphaerospermopsis sp.]